MLNRLPLDLQIRQSIPPDALGLVGRDLRVAQPLRAAIEALSAGEELLALLELVVGGGGVGVAVPEQGFAVVGEGFEFAFGAVDVGFEVAEALVDFGARDGGDVGSFDAHLIELLCTRRLEKIGFCGKAC